MSRHENARSNQEYALAALVHVGRLSTLRLLFATIFVVSLPSWDRPKLLMLTHLLESDLDEIIL
jgi:hypothetical protein